MIDAHHHFWSLSRGDYAWPDASVEPIHRDFGPEDLNLLLSAAGVAGTVLVQATDSLDETRYLLQIAEGWSMALGVVGWVDLAANNAVDAMDDLRATPLLRGFRPMLQNIEETDWILQPEVQPAIEHMEKTGLTFDALIQPRHLSTMETLAIRYPRLKIVIDHLSKPDMRRAELDPHWAHGMRALAGRANVWCKLSGMVTEAGEDWSFETLSRHADVVLDAFGPERVMWGSDWPVVNLAADYQRWLDTAMEITADLSSDQQQRVFSGTAMNFYGLTAR